MKNEECRMKNESLIYDSSPKGEGSRIKDLKDLKGTTEKTEKQKIFHEKHGI
jgi:hypothetical protein